MTYQLQQGPHSGLSLLPPMNGSKRYNRTALLSVLATHRRTDEPGLPIEARCFCGWTGVSWASHVADQYERA